MNFLINLVRFIVGVLFIFSGLVKANDPLGLSYKMQEFFELWGMHALNDYTLAFSVIMIAFEIIAGVAVLVGWKMNLFSWLLLLLIMQGSRQGLVVGAHRGFRLRLIIATVLAIRRYLRR